MAYARASLLWAGLAVAVGCGPQIGGDDGAEGGTGSVESDGSEGDPSGSHSDSGDGSGDGSMPNPSAGDPSAGDPTGDPSGGGPTGDTGDSEPIGDDLCDAALGMGLSGLTNERSCDTGPDDECVSPSSGVPVAVFDQNPLVSGGELESGELDPTIVALDQATSDGSGRFQFALPTGSYVVCRLEGETSAFCTETIAIDDVTPLSKVIYETGNGDWWSVIDCAP